jgi:hypothetical protein
MFSLSSCFQKFYKTNTVYKTDSTTLQKLVDEKKSFIVHSPQGIFVIKNPSVGVGIFVGEKAAVTSDNKKFLHPSPDKGNRFPKNQSDEVLNEVHLYTSVEMPPGKKLGLNLNYIYRVDVYGFDKEATKDSGTSSIVGITLGVAFVVAVAIAAATFTVHL